MVLVLVKVLEHLMLLEECLAHGKSKGVLATIVTTTTIIIIIVSGTYHILPFKIFWLILIRTISPTSGKNHTLSFAATPCHSSLRFRSAHQTCVKQLQNRLVYH